MAGYDQIICIMAYNKEFVPLNTKMLELEYIFYLNYPNKQELFYKACKHGKIEVIKLLTPYIDPRANDNLAIQIASFHGHLEVVKYLLTLCTTKDIKVDPTAMDNFAIRWASSNGHLEVVKYLVTLRTAKDMKVDPTADNNFAIRLASQKGHLEVVKYL